MYSADQLSQSRLVSRVAQVWLVAAMTLGMPRVAHAASAYSQSYNVLQATAYSDWLEGSGTNFTLETPPSAGTLLIQVGYSGPYVPWTNSINTVPWPNFEYIPDPDFVGYDWFIWHCSDAAGNSASVSCLFNVQPNSVPFASAQNLAFGANTTNDSIALHYTDPNGSSQTHTFTLVTVPANGTLANNGTLQAGSTLTNTSTVYYTPQAGYTGVDAFTWNVCDGIATSATVTVTITISQHPPVICNPSPSLTCLRNSTNNLSPFLAYSHTDVGQVMTYTLICAPTNGMLQVNGTGSVLTAGTIASLKWTYAPTTGFTGGDSFTWSVSDGMATATGQVAIAVVPPSTPVMPVFKSGVKLMIGTNVLALGTRVVNGKYDWASRGSGYVRNNTAVLAAPELADWDNDGLMDLVVGQADGRIALLRNQGTIGAPIFTGYEYLTLATGKPICSELGQCLCQGGGTECPAPRVVDWNNDGRKDLILGEWNGCGSYNLLVYLNNGSDVSPSFDRFANCTLYGSGVNGANTAYPTTMPFITDWYGTGNMDLISGDNPSWSAHWGGTNNSAINVFLGTSLDHSCHGVLQNTYVNYETYNWAYYTPADSFQSSSPSIVLTNACPKGSRKSVVAADWSGCGRQDLVIGMQDGTVWYAPNSGTRNFPVYTNYFNLQAGGSNVIIGSSAKIGKDPIYPYATGMNQGQMVTIAQNEARLAVGDLDGDGLPDLVIGDVNGNITVFYQYNPNPVAIDQNVLAMPDYPKAITLTAKVDSGHAVTFNVVSNALNGQLTGTAPSLIYTPNTGYTGTDNFSFQANDGPTNSRVATVAITVRGHAPVAQWTSPVTLSSTAILNMNTSLVMTLTAADDGDELLHYTVATQPTHGTINLSGSQATYTPTPGYAGLDSFAYRADDGYLSSAPATINLDVCVLAVNFQPTNAPALAGFRVDNGANYSTGYGWNTNLMAAATQRNFDPNPLLDTFVCSTSATWRCDLSNGAYWVSFACGDALPLRSAFYGPHQIALQGVTLFSTNTSFTSTDGFLHTNVLATVTNGQLTVQIGDGVHKTDLNYLLVRSAYPVAGSASYVREDPYTQGAWMGVYGADGYKLVTYVINSGGFNKYEGAGLWDASLYELASVPSYATVDGPSNGDWLTDAWPRNYWLSWDFPSADPRSLQYPTLETSIAAAWTTHSTISNLTADINFTDGQTHQVAVYCLSWGNNAWTQRMDVVDGVDGTLLDSRMVSAMGNGKWEVWNISGHAQIRATKIGTGSAVISGLFFGTCNAPQITRDPFALTVQAGGTATFDVLVTGAGVLAYQWQWSTNNGTTWVNVPGATAQTYAFTAQPGNNGGLARCNVSSLYGSAVSAAAMLTTSAALPPAPVIISPLVVSAVFGQPFSYTITALNNPDSFDAFLPPNWALDSQGGVLSINPAQVQLGGDNADSFVSGQELIPIYAYNDGGVDAQLLTVLINPTNAPVITNVLLATVATVGQPFSYPVGATWSPTSTGASGLPAGITNNPATGLISGVPLPGTSGAYTVQLTAKNANGTGYAYLSLTVVSPPVIVSQPLDYSAPVGQPAVFKPIIIGDAPITFQWAKNGTNIVGATGAVFTIATVATNDAGVYTVIASNAVGGATSSGATLTVTTVAVSPFITTQPTNQTVVVNNPASFTVVAGGTSPLYYQWSQNGSNVAGATNATWSLASAALTNAGAYRVMVGNYAGAVTSSVATLTVSDMLVEWWKFDEVSGTNAMDSSGCNNTGKVQGATVIWTNGLQQGAIYLQGGYGITNYVAANTISAAPQVFTVSLWFRAANTNGGRLIGFGSAKTGVSATYDRNIYINKYGNLAYGIVSSGYITPTSSQSYTDGKWHHVAATLSTAGMLLYADGACVASNGLYTSSARTANGYWRVGYDSLASFPNLPACQAFCGSIDDARVYNRALSASEIAAIANTPVGGLPLVWITQNFGGLCAASDPNADPDGDGMTNLQEYLAGTNPMDANSHFKVNSLSTPAAVYVNGPQTMIINFDTVGGTRYGIYWRTNLTDGSGWTLYSTLNGLGGAMQITVPTGGAQMFYKIQLLP